MGKIINHWGIYVDSDIPVTGVLNSNSVAWEYITDEICLTCKEILQDIENVCECPICEDSCDCENCDDCQYAKEQESEFIECDSSHTRIFGDWILDTLTDKYDIDYTGEFSAIENEGTIQIVYSKYTQHGALCSPCYPGQIDLDSPGEFIGYTLPDDLVYKY